MFKLSSHARKGLSAVILSAVAALALSLTTACAVYDYDGGRRGPPPAAHKAPPPPRGEHKAPPPRGHYQPARPAHNDRYHSIVVGPAPGFWR